MKGITQCPEQPHVALFPPRQESLIRIDARCWCGRHRGTPIVFINLPTQYALPPRPPNSTTSGSWCPRKCTLQPHCLGLAPLQVFQLLTLRLERILSHLVLHMLLVTVRQKPLDDVRKLRVFVQRFCPALFPFLQLVRGRESKTKRGSRVGEHTSFVVDMYVTSTACPVFSIAADSWPCSDKLNPLRIAPSSAWSCEYSRRRGRIFNSKVHAPSVDCGLTRPTLHGPSGDLLHIPAQMARKFVCERLGIQEPLVWYT